MTGVAGKEGVPKIRSQAALSTPFLFCGNPTDFPWPQEADLGVTDLSSYTPGAPQFPHTARWPGKWERGLCVGRRGHSLHVDIISDPV